MNEVTRQDIMRLVEQYRDIWLGGANIDRGIKAGRKIVEIGNAISVMQHQQYNAGAASVMARHPEYDGIHDADHCTCPWPLWAPDEDARGYPVQVCELCDKPQSETDAVRDAENIRAHNADMAVKR